MSVYVAPVGAVGTETSMLVPRQRHYLIFYFKQSGNLPAYF